MSALSEKSSANPLEQFLQRGKQAEGQAAVELVLECLEAQGVYVFGELLDLPNIKKLETGQYADVHKLLKLFAYGTYKEYKKDESSLRQLNPNQLKKLKHLTLVTLATTNKRLPYNMLLQELDINNVRILEDLIIEAIYADVIRGKLDQRGQQLEIDYAIGRDIRLEAIGDIVSILQDWCSTCDSTIKEVNKQIHKANEKKESFKSQKQKMEQEVSHIKRTLKAAQQQQMEMDDHMMMDSHGLGSRRGFVSRNKPMTYSQRKGNK